MLKTVMAVIASDNCDGHDDDDRNDDDDVKVQAFNSSRTAQFLVI